LNSQAKRYRNVYMLGLVSLFTDLSSQMVFPLLPLFMTSVLGAGAMMVGLVEGGAEAVASILKAFSGMWSDRVRRRKPFVVAGYAMSAMAKPLFATAGSVAGVLGIRLTERIGKGLRNAPRDALVAESVDVGSRGRAFGFHRSMDGIGSVLGALAAFLLLPALGFRKLFLVAIIPGIIAIFFTLLVFERRKSSGEEAEKETKERRKISFRVLPSNLKLYIMAAAVFTLGHFGYAFLLLRAKDVGLADVRAILFYVIFYMVYTLISIPAGSLSDRVGRKPVLIFCYPFFGVISIMLLLSATSWMVLTCFVLYGIFYGMIDGVQRAFVADLAPPHLKATAMGAFHSAIGLAALPGGLIAGALWQQISPSATFGFGAGMSLIGLLLVSLVSTSDKQLQEA
jgi:MFS family permease